MNTIIQLFDNFTLPENIASKAIAKFNCKPIFDRSIKKNKKLKVNKCWQKRREGKPSKNDWDNKGEILEEGVDDGF